MEADNSTLKKIAESMQQNDMTYLRESINELETALDNSDFIAKAKMPEFIFKDTFLPTIAGKTQDNGVIIMKYVDYAGGPYREVDVVDKDGNILFTCPPLYNRSENKDNNKRLPYDRIASTYELKKARLPAEATNYLNEISKGIENNISIENGSSSEFRWDKIFDKYYKEEHDITDTNVVPKILNENRIDDDLINYD